MQVFKVSTSREIDAVFEGFVRERPDALLAPISAFLMDRRVQLALQAAICRVPATYALREFVEAGGLMSYGASLRDAYRQVGTYAGRILKGIAAKKVALDHPHGERGHRRDQPSSAAGSDRLASRPASGFTTAS